MHGCIGITQQGAQAEGYPEPHENAHNPRNRQKKSHFQCVQLSQHENCVSKHEQVSTSHQVSIEKNCIRADVTKAFGCIRKSHSIRFAKILNCLNKLLLPLKCCFISKLKFKTTSLIVHQLNIFGKFQLPDHLSSFG